MTFQADFPILRALTSNILLLLLLYQLPDFFQNLERHFASHKCAQAVFTPFEKSRIKNYELFYIILHLRQNL